MTSPLIRRIGRSRPVSELAALVAVSWLRTVRVTTRFVEEPKGLFDGMGVEGPFIVAGWHGNHFLVPFMCRPAARFRAIVSRSADGDIIAAVLGRLGMGQVRGSGGAPSRQREKGGATALRALARSLAEGYCVAMTADVPRIGGVAGAGIVTLARLSGCPIITSAAATSRFIRLNNWDRAVINLPFGRGAFVVGDVIHVPRDADDVLLEEKRLAVQASLDRANQRAYALVGQQFQSSRR